MNYDPTIVNDGADVERLNTLLDQLLEKPFLSPTVAVNAIRAALDIHGILLPKLDCETEINGPNMVDAASIMMTGSPGQTVPLDVEYLFKIQDADGGEDRDWDDYLYLYIVLNRNEEVGVYEAYAQICDADDVDALIWADIPQELADLHPDLMGADVSGETPYLRQVRHTGTGGYTSEA